MDHSSVSELISSIRPTHLLHLAWITEPRRYPSAPENLDWLSASLHLMRAFRESGGQRAVGSGTCFEYDWNYGWCREELTPLNPTTLYGTCKKSVNTVLTDFARESGLSWGWGRVFFLYGPHANVLKIPACVIDSLMKNQPARCSAGYQIRDFMHVSDVASALVALLDSDCQGAVNIASGEPIMIRDIVLKIADHFGRHDLLEFGAIPTSASEPPLLVADVRRLKNELGWSPTYQLTSGLANTIEWMTEQSRLATRSAA
jgi:nucleoside-diphosphate-sugar epimerase